MRQSKSIALISTAVILVAALIYSVAPAQSPLPGNPQSAPSTDANHLKHTAMAVLEMKWLSDDSLAQIQGKRNPTTPVSIDTLRYEIAGSDAVGQVVDDLGLTDFLPQQEDGSLFDEGKKVRQQIIKMIVSGIEIELSRSAKNTRLIYVKLNFTNRHQTPRIVNRLLDNFIESQNSRADQDRIQLGKLIETKLASAQKHLEKIDAQALQIELDYPGLLPSSPDSPEHVLANLNTQIHKSRRQRDLALAQINRLTELIKGSVGLSPLEQTAIDQVATDIAHLQGEADYADQELAQLDAHLGRYKKTRNDTVRARKQHRDLTHEILLTRQKLESWQKRQHHFSMQEDTGQKNIQYRILERAPES